MSLSKLKMHLSRLWVRFNLAWVKADEMQRRIDEARTENHRRYGIQWRI